MIAKNDIKKFVYIFIIILAVTMLMYLIMNKIPYAKELPRKIFHFKTDSETIEI